MNYNSLLDWKAFQNLMVSKENKTLHLLEVSASTEEKFKEQTAKAHYPYC